ncbi:hypothetical protein NFIA_068050 [Paecilomyces variotii No. 5]|uniref:DNA replication regulator SLD2 n=1 Tax=Byssochlamys spectabilis (strain No. 5 / NBRC 109023) TaxID=1356009 RepID=V5GEN1_BYSSN|nr:hypothetical protein NFIA_068050 [Paecilomyces variotii No. 5]
MMANADVLLPMGSADVAVESTALRAELKEWERTFAAANGGKKAGREDIKQNPEIAAKYKAYSRLRSEESSASRHGKEDRADKTERHSKVEKDVSKKRKHGSPTGPGNALNALTPRKAARGDMLTPQKSRSLNGHPSQLDPYDSPSTLRRLFSPSTHRQTSSSPMPLKTAIGPTPQRDGKALGLFDLLSASGGSTATPSAKRMSAVPTANIQTPSRKRMDAIKEGDEDDDDEDNFLFKRTPASESKRFLLSSFFATPTTMRYAAMVEDEEGLQKEDASQANARAAEEQTSETPSFLRRSTSGRMGPPNAAAGASGMSPVAVRKPQRLFGKSLSALVQGLRDMEEEQMEDDWEILKEIEAEQAAEAAANDVEEGDSQAPEGQRTWKKKGQKRTTRRVVMRPVLSKPKLAPETKAGNEADDVPEAQTESREDENADDAASEPDQDSDPDYEGDARSLKKTSSFSEKMKAAFSSVVNIKNNDKSSAPAAPEDAKAKKPVARKVNPEAHANYRSLKIRNKNSKGRGRFGRRR